MVPVEAWLGFVVTSQEAGAPQRYKLPQLFHAKPTSPAGERQKGHPNVCRRGEPRAHISSHPAGPAGRADRDSLKGDATKGAEAQAEKPKNASAPARFGE